MTREALQSALSLFSAQERRILLLCFFGQKTQAEISAAVGVPEEDVRQIIEHTLSRLHAELVVTT
ncbi:sigma factor-like helix-turn-helix DNA-binding protein [Nocardiopsis ansamitocini]|nr:sigma factor-like helix-turn-helix DNA-binding protein [Nocardiopsis ansamitocini]